ncbi:hypothetical protein Sta7437_3246 [Stanieria cyanosphaera PCC 7437]|uniref:Uncharacterized protein n=1 Tax=Stanieria cyanosphaera (strain ATCC 29371 / PCC 7437) TaxID=111780 RepID=K9XW42_STAC7|nr:hypothetical protein [Stanieria cyanosphaera]AFZ36753.1 hypothetical protein Sta7437_3246 [Stanieria cyanosphaera PCC 7437]
MANIQISELSPLGTALFADNESLMGSIRDLTEDELKITGGSGKGSGSKKSGSKKSKSKKSKSKKSKKSGSCGCGYGC